MKAKLGGGSVGQGVRPADTLEAVLMDRAVEYEAFAEAYGWTPRQVEQDIPHLMRQRILTVRDVRHELERERRKG